MQEFNIQTYQNLVSQNSPVSRENLFILLGKIQDMFGYVPAEAIRDLAAKTGLAEARIYGALTSYKDFKVHKEGAA